eukprot:scaffold284381_cov83-Cyclotella_meneghiniana.AAC.3
MGDGFCCKFGNGAFEMKLNDEVVGEQYGGGFKVKQMDFVVEDSSGGFVWVEAVEETTEEATTTVVPTTTEETTTTTTTTDEPITTAAGPTTSEETTTTTTIEETTSSSTATTTTEISATEMVSFTILTEAKEEESDILDTISTDILDEITETTSTVDPWENYNPKWSKFCGPKIVGGYAIAIAQCSPQTMCGLSTVSDHYGSNGNDCPKGLMCFSDITCENTPPDSSNALFNGRISPNDDDTMNGRMNGEIKSMEVSLKQDLEKSRIQEMEEAIDVDASLQENSAMSNGLSAVSVGVAGVNT